MISNGGRSLQSTRATQQSLPTLDDASLLVHEAPCSPLNASLEGELIHLTCPVNYGLSSLGDGDPLLRSTPAEQRLGLKLEAYMEVYQWEEFPYTKKVGKRNVRDHMYFREFYPRSPPPNTSFFGEGRKCRVDNGGRDCYQWDPEQVEPWWNSSQYQFGWTTLDQAQNMTIGGSYVLPGADGLIDEIAKLAGNPRGLQPACILDGDNDEQSPCGAAILRDDGRTIAWQQLDSNGENVDYLTRTYDLYTIDSISILARQRGNSFVPWETANGKSLFEFVPGSQTAAQMIEAAKSPALATPDGRIGALLSFVGLFLMVVLG